MKLKPIGKKGAFEMSMSTIVVIVIAVVLLVLGLVFVRQIFGTATQSVSVVDEQVRNKLKTMFGEDESYVTIYNKVTKIKPSDEAFRVPLGARTRTGEAITSSFKYKIEYVSGSCDGSTVKNAWMEYPQADSWNSFDDYEFDVGFVDLTLRIPKGTPKCTAIMRMGITDSGNSAFASKTFTIEVV